MLLREVFATPAELKFVGEPKLGYLEGHAAVIGNMDLKGDMLMPGSLDATMAEHKANGTMPFMYAEHSAYVGGDPLPIGKWTEMDVDETGLHVKGHLIGLEHPDVARVLALMEQKVMGGISIAWAPREGGVVRGTKAGEPKRYLNSIDVFSCDPVCDPANRLARLDSVKAMMAMPNHQAAAQSLVQARDMCETCMKGGDAPTSAERQQIVGHLNEAHRHLTGQDIPPMAGMKSKPETLRLFEDFLREQGGYSHREARLISDRGIKSLLPRDEDEAAVNAARKEAVGAIRSLLTGFNLNPKES